MEDFAQIAGKTEEKEGINYKYSFSYERLAELVARYTTAPKIEVENFFRLVVFNYLFSNGDAHIKNFSLIEDSMTRGRTLSPAYDLLNTEIHVPRESDMALELFEADFMTEAFKAGSKFTKEDFEVFAKKTGINSKRFSTLYDPLLKMTEKVSDLINSSFLRDDLKAIYFSKYLERRRRLER